MKTKIVTISAIMAVMLLVPMAFAEEGRPGPRPRERLGAPGAEAGVFQDLTPEQRARVREFVQTRLQQQRERIEGQMRDGEERPQAQARGRGFARPQDRPERRLGERSGVPGPLAERFQDLTPEQRARIREHFQSRMPQQRQRFEGQRRGQGFGPQMQWRGQGQMQRPFERGFQRECPNCRRPMAGQLPNN